MPAQLATARFRIFLLAATALLALSLAGCATLQTVGAVLTNRIAFAAPQLQGYLDRYYPREYDQLGGLVTLSVINPHLTIPEHGNRLHLDFDVGIDGLGLSSDRTAGHFAITSALRFDTDAYALYLEDPRLESADLPLLGGRMNATGRDLINGWLRDYARAEPVYRFDRKEIETLGRRRVSGTLIEDGKVVIRLDD